MYNNGMAVMTMSEARAALPEVLNRVADGEEITITRHGKPAAVVVRPDVLWSRARAGSVLADADRLEQLLASAAVDPLPHGEGSGITAQRAEELVAAIRAGRDGR
jgi:antitoxin (DNA-binding transcriptional repressor) of toxin-antitoxin stability system